MQNETPVICFKIVVQNASIQNMLILKSKCIVISVLIHHHLMIYLLYEYRSAIIFFFILQPHYSKKEGTNEC